MDELLPHSLTLESRERLTMTGVSEVVRFDEEEVELRTELGTLLVQGRDLKLRTLSPKGGTVAVEGTVTVLSYEEPGRGGASGASSGDGPGGVRPAVPLGPGPGAAPGGLVFLPAAPGPPGQCPAGSSVPGRSLLGLALARLRCL